MNLKGIFINKASDSIIKSFLNATAFSENISCLTVFIIEPYICYELLFYVMGLLNIEYKIIPHIMKGFINILKYIC